MASVRKARGLAPRDPCHLKGTRLPPPPGPGCRGPAATGSMKCLTCLHSPLVPETRAIGVEEARQLAECPPLVPVRDTALSPGDLMSLRSGRQTQVNLLISCMSLKRQVHQDSMFSPRMVTKNSPSLLCRESYLLMLTSATGTVPSDDELTLLCTPNLQGQGAGTGGFCLWRQVVEPRCPNTSCTSLLYLQTSCPPCRTGSCDG